MENCTANNNNDRKQRHVLTGIRIHRNNVKDRSEQVIDLGPLTKCVNQSLEWKETEAVVIAVSQITVATKRGSDRVCKPGLQPFYLVTQFPVNDQPLAAALEVLIRSQPRYGSLVSLLPIQVWGMWII
jgi:hypothetical protein